MEYVNCDFCAANETKLLLKGKDRQFYIEGEFNIVQCKRCGLIYLNPRPSPEEMAKYYPEGYSPFKDSANFIIQGLKNLILKNDIFKFKKLIPRGADILEIGCANGRYLASLRDIGEWNVKGVELDFKASETARNKYGLDVITGSILEVDLPANSFDLIIMKHVFEHLHSPNTAMKKMAKLLKNNGKVIMWIPNINSLEFKIFGKYWSGLDVPRHLYNFDKYTLRNIFNRASLTIESIRYSLVPNDCVHSFGYYLNRKRCCPHSSFFNIDNPLALLMFLPFSFFASLLKKSGKIRVIIRKAKSRKEQKSATLL